MSGRNVDQAWVQLDGLPFNEADVVTAAAECTTFQQQRTMLSH